MKALRVGCLLLPLLAQAQERLPPVPPTPLAAAPTRLIERLELQGVQALPLALFETAAKPWLGRALDESEIEALRQRLTRVYVDHGFVNSGLLIAEGQGTGTTLRLQAIEGRLTQVQLRGLAGLNPEHVKSRLGATEGALNMDALRERFQLLLNDPLLARVQARLLPGERLGEAVLDIEVERARPWKLSAFANNHRPVSVGEGAMGLRGQLSNLTGQGDQLDALLLGPLKGEGSRKGQQRLDWRTPLTAWGAPFTQVSLAAERSDSAIVEEPVRQLDIRSATRGWELGVSQLWSESTERRHSSGLQAQARRQRSTLLGEPYSFTAGVPDGRVRETVWRIWHETQWRSPQQVLVLRGHFNWGHNNVQREAAVPGLEAAPAPSFQYATLQAQWLRRLGPEGLSLSARLLAQASRDRLLPSSGIALGGVNSVRGQRENQAVRDEGWVANLGLPWVWKEGQGGGLRVELEPFYDHGRVRNRGQAWVELASAGLALKLGWRGALLEIAAAERVRGDAASTQKDSLQDRGVHVQLSYAL